ncbi:type III pantothenate kinase [Massilibacteroides sp.]|uniref:type III pantothenate kinase n=1 Tax=Massilibacteroides sp. TaxID=2034766 RepID=UPI00262F5517|nr:type III pantothenate kinase [Massilibacteroides sp.]MDD4514134.1 type III pantothenate kinase [Massilibacteroides sp.]
MNLIIEQGNSSSKVAVYSDERIVEYLQYKTLEEQTLMPLFDKYQLTQGILSTVIAVDDELNNYLKGRLERFIFLDETTRLPIINTYKTPATLGKDRIAAVVGANYLHPGRDILVIDAGTAITYDFINALGVYLGGSISPGMTTRFKALNYYTSQLPLVKETEDIPPIGFDTVSSIQSGVVNGIIYEMNSYIEDYRRKSPSLLVFLTGGHSNYFERRLKNSIFADINLVLTGLNRILEYNVEN